MRSGACVVIVAALCGASALGAAAQDKFVTFEVLYEKAVLLPGETQTITVRTTLTPGVGEEVMLTTPPFEGQIGNVIGLAGFNFGLIDLGGGGSGAFSDWHVLDPWGGPIVKPQHGTPDGLGNILAISGGQFGPPIQTYIEQEPALVWQVEWTPDEGFSGEVEFTTAVTPGKQAVVWLKGDFYQFWADDDWPTVHQVSSFFVVPAPAGMLVLIVAGAALRRRR